METDGGQQASQNPPARAFDPTPNAPDPERDQGAPRHAVRWAVMKAVEFAGEKSRDEIAVRGVAQGGEAEQQNRRWHDAFSTTEEARAAEANQSAAKSEEAMGDWGWHKVSAFILQSTRWKRVVAIPA